MNLKALVQEKKVALVREYEVVKRKLAAVEALSQLTDKHLLELELFDLWDTGNEGHLSFEDLARGVAEMPQLAQFLSREELIELRTQANDNKVDRAEFGHLLEKLGQKTGGDFKDWVELLALIWQPNEHKIVRGPELDASFQTSQGSLEEAVSATAHDGRMRNLFALFDADLDNKINFKDIAMSLRKIAPHVPLATASEAAVKVLLDFDKDHDRMLDYMEFVHFILAFLRAGGLEFAQVADALVLAAARPDPSDEEIAQFDTVCASQNFSTFADYRLHQIFDLWDRDGDGFISFKELCLGLHKFEPTKSLKSTVEHAALLVQQSRLKISEDDPESQQFMDRAQFANVLSDFIAESGAQFDQVADYLVAISSSAVDDAAAFDMPGWFYKPLNSKPVPMNTGN